MDCTRCDVFRTNTRHQWMPICLLIQLQPGKAVVYISPVRLLIGHVGESPCPVPFLGTLPRAPVSLSKSLRFLCLGTLSRAPESGCSARDSSAKHHQSGKFAPYVEQNRSATILGHNLDLCQCLGCLVVFVDCHGLIRPKAEKGEHLAKPSHLLYCSTECCILGVACTERD